MIWNHVDDGVGRRRPDVILGNEADRRPEIAEGSSFWPATPAFDGSHLWVGEFRLSGRLLSCAVEP